MGRVIPRDSLVGIVGGPLVWTVHFLLVYVFTAVACAFRFADLTFLGTSIVNSLMVIATLLAVAVIGWLGWLAWGRYRRAGGPERTDDPLLSRHQFFSLVALLLCVLSAIGVVYEGIPLLMLPACG